MNVAWYRTRNAFRKVATRLRYPPPLYKKIGTLSAVVNRADGSKEVLKNISISYTKRWGTGTGA